MLGGPSRVLRVSRSGSGQHIAVHAHGDAGKPVVMVHGNSCSSRCFEKQLSSALSRRFRLFAMDLPGHGDSAYAADPGRTYSLHGYASALVDVASQLGVLDAVFVGWSLGGHVVLEASGDLPRAAGFLIFGTPPLASSADMPRAFSANPAIGAAFRAESTEEEMMALLSLFFRPGFPVPQGFVEDFRQTDRRARSEIAASVGRNELRDEVRIVAEMRAPLAIVHGAQESVIVRSYFDPLSMPTLWRGSVQEIGDAGHAPQWETPEAFNRLLDTFASECLEAT